MTEQAFLWGASTAAHQIEGGNTGSDWWRFEHSGHPRIVEPSGDAVDSYHRWDEDMDLLAAAGFTDYRFSIEWARIEPAPGEFSAAQLAHYAAMIGGALTRGIRPMVTLHHFTIPQWFEDAGGWKAEGATARFATYIKAICPLLDGVRHVCTINEPNVVALFPALLNPQPGSRLKLDSELSAAMVTAHHAAREVLRDRLPEAQVGWSVGAMNLQPDPSSPEDPTEVLRALRQAGESMFYEAASDDDWVGVQAYARRLVGCSDGAPTLPTPPAGTPMSINDWEVYPPAAGESVREAARVVGSVPIIVTENGLATEDDDQRIAYTTGALAGLRSAMDDGVDLRGYFHWSLLDNYEWGSYAPTFGLIAVDRRTFVRTPKPSLQWLGAQRALFGSAGEATTAPMTS